MVSKQWPLTIKGNIFINCISGLFGLLWLVIGVFTLWAGFAGNHGVSFFIFLISLIFLCLGFRFLSEVIKTTIHFKIAVDDSELCLFIGGKYIVIPKEYVENIGSQYGIGTGGTSLIIQLKEDFSPYKNFLENYFFKLCGHRIRYDQLELEMAPSQARDLIKAYLVKT